MSGKKRLEELSSGAGRGVKLNDDQLGAVSGGNYSPGVFTGEALAYMKSCLGDEKFGKVMGPAKAREHPYVAAKLFLSPMEWEKYVWIEQHGSIDGFV